ncbi:hypothetical protein IHE45_07G077700 [Dioscorea alata]|uniref:Uncharacterized protein n=1 Tax=Dioscorea alata TaxID=55571 RepID=A0ACB7VSA8_DIOAL|nr:hypothetical protein IHE45_07G077700 [Dioscorea alata]
MQAWKRLLPHSLHISCTVLGEQVLMRIVTNPFLVLAIFICSIACLIHFYFNKPNTKDKQEFCFVYLPT